MKFCLYTAKQEENIFVRKQAKSWQRSGLITQDQLTIMEKYADPDLNQTNVFFRILFFIFTSLCAGAVIALILWLTDFHDKCPVTAALFVFSIIFYLLAEYIIKNQSFYRYGIEEALALTSLASLTAGCGFFITDWHLDYHLWIIIICLIFSLAACWLYLRFGFLYTALFSIAGFCIIPFQLTVSAVTERILLLSLLVLIFLTNLVLTQNDAEDFQRERNVIIQACIIAAIYLTINLRIPVSAVLYYKYFSVQHLPYAGFPPYLYWLSYLLTFLLPAAILYWGIKTRGRVIINLGLLAAFITLATNKDYLGLKHFSWDPAIMGTLMIALSILLKRWLSETRYGFTAENILKPETHGISPADIGAALAPSFIQSQQPAGKADNFFNDGKSGGGGAARGF